MDLFTPERPEWTIEQMMAQLELSYSTVYRYVRSLVSVGLVFSLRPGRYLLGPGIIPYERQFRLADPLIRAAQSTLRNLAAAVQPPGALFIARVYRDHVMSMFEQQLDLTEFVGSYGRGQFMPLYRGAPPLAILAHTPIRNLKRHFLEAHRTNVDPLANWRQFRREMRKARSEGFAIDAGGIDPHAMYVSVPLFQRDGGVAGSLSLGAPLERAAAAADLIMKLGAAAKEIGERAEATPGL